MFYKWSLYRRILKYSSPVITIAEKRKIAKYGNTSPAQPCIFIIGAPRTGSTILYQLVTNIYDLLYIDNLVNLARQNPYFGFWLSKKLFHYKPHESYSSNFGDTTREGLHAPCEGLFWYKWLPKDRHYTEPSDLDHKQMKDFRQTVNAIINRFNKPLIIKNLSFSLRLKLLKELFPEAKYIIIHRSPLFTSQSLWIAKKKNHVPDRQVWGILPRQFQHLEKLNSYEQIVKQIYLIEQQIYHDIRMFPEDNVMHINYEDLIPDPEKVINRIARFIRPDLSRRAPTQLPEIKIRNKINLQEHEIQNLKHYIKELDWTEFKTNIHGDG